MLESVGCPTVETPTPDVTVPLVVKLPVVVRAPFTVRLLAPPVGPTVRLPVVVSVPFTVRVLAVVNVPFTVRLLSKVEFWPLTKICQPYTKEVPVTCAV